MVTESCYNGVTALLKFCQLFTIPLETAVVNYGIVCIAGKPVMEGGTGKSVSFNTCPVRIIRAVAPIKMSGIIVSQRQYFHTYPSNGFFLVASSIADIGNRDVTGRKISGKE